MFQPLAEGAADKAGDFVFECFCLLSPQAGQKQFSSGNIRRRPNPAMPQRHIVNFIGANNDIVPAELDDKFFPIQPPRPAGGRRPPPRQPPRSNARHSSRPLTANIHAKIISRRKFNFTNRKKFGIFRPPGGECDIVWAMCFFFGREMS